METKRENINGWLNVGIMEAIPFSMFPEAEINFFSRNGSVKFRYTIGNVGANHVDQYVYCYFVTPPSRIENSWNVRGSSAGDFPTVYERRLGVHNIEWRFSKVTPGEIDFLLVYIVGNGYLTRSELICESKARKEDVALALKPLASAARKYGIPKNGLPITHIYTEGEETKRTNKVSVQNVSDDDRYFKVLGLVPTSNIGIVKAAYRELVKQYHPDTNTGISQERMKEINEAYEYIVSKIQIKDNLQ